MRDDVRALLARMARLSVSDLADQFDRWGRSPPVLGRELRAVGPTQRFAGPAFCVDGRKLNASGWVPTPRDSLYDSLPERVPPGSVLLFATGGYDAAAVFGGVTAAALQRRGTAGVIVDGTVRDTEEIARCGLPLLARGASAIRFIGRFALTAIDVPIELRGLAGPVAAASGDLVLADRDGAIVVPYSLAPALIDAAEKALGEVDATRAEPGAGAERAFAPRPEAGA